MIDLSSFDPAEIIERSKETCEACAHCRGPIILICVNQDSDFYEGAVHRLGWCPAWTAEVQA